MVLRGGLQPVIDRFRKWLHRGCQLERGTASALLSVGEQLAALSGGMLLLRQGLEKVPERVTVIAFGTRAPGLEMVGNVEVVTTTPDPLIVVDSKTVRLRGTAAETITLETMFPVQSFQVVVMADFDRVELRGLFLRTDLIGMASPIGFGKEWRPGEQVRAIVARREVGA